jgi:hypothetical protein
MGGARSFNPEEATKTTSTVQRRSTRRCPCTSRTPGGQSAQPRATIARFYPLTGHLYGECGNRYSGILRANKGWRQYRCTAQYQGGCERCRTRGFMPTMSR